MIKIKPKISKIKLQEFGLTLLIKLILDLMYIYFLNPNYGYMGFVLSINQLKILESYILLIIAYSFLPSREKLISAVALKFLFVFSLVPALSIYGMKDLSRQFMYIWVFGFILTAFTVLVTPRLRFLLKKHKMYKVFLFSGVFLTSFFVYLALLRERGLPNFELFRFGRVVYKFRESTNWELAIMNYLIPWQAKVINPFLLGLFLWKRKYKFSLAVVLLQIFLFTSTGHKYYLFSIGFVPFIWYVDKKSYPVMKSLVIIIILIISFSLIMHTFGVTVRLASMTIRRTFFTPAQIAFWYHDFFSQNPHTLLSQSSLNLILGTSNPYPDVSSITNMMGAIYVGNPDTNMNTGYIGDSFMNFGFGGVVLFSLFIGFILVCLDSIRKGVSFPVATSAVIVPIFSLLNSGLFTSIGTHGLLLGMVIILMFRINKRFR